MWLGCRCSSSRWTICRRANMSSMYESKKFYLLEWYEMDVNEVSGFFSFDGYIIYYYIIYYCVFDTTTFNRSKLFLLPTPRCENFSLLDVKIFHFLFYTFCITMVLTAFLSTYFYIHFDAIFIYASIFLFFTFLGCFSLTPLFLIVLKR